MVTLLNVPAEVAQAISAASTIEGLAEVAQAIPATVFTAGNRTPLDAPGVFEALARAFELTHDGAESAPARRVIASHLSALVSGSRSHGMVSGDNRPREWSQGHTFTPIALGSLGGVLTGIYDLQRSLRRAAETLTPEGGARLKALVWSLDAILKAVVYRAETLDVSDFDDEVGTETF
jgi:hypothetical protein